MAFDPQKPNTSQTLGDVVTSTSTNLVDLDARIAAHLADATTAHGSAALLTTQAEYNLHAADSTTAHGVGVLGNRATALELEVTAGRGTASTLTGRLDSALEQSGAIKLSSLNNRWLDNSDTPTYVNTTTFTVPGDRTKVYIAGVLMRFTVSTGYVYGVVATVSFGATTQVVLDAGYPVLNNTLSKAELGLLSFDNTIAATVAAQGAAITALTARVSALE